MHHPRLVQSFHLPSISSLVSYQAGSRGTEDEGGGFFIWEWWVTENRFTKVFIAINGLVQGKIWNRCIWSRKIGFGPVDFPQFWKKSHPNMKHGWSQIYPNYVKYDVYINHRFWTMVSGGLVVWTRDGIALGIARGIIWQQSSWENWVSLDP